ncbi:MAG: hypothetical protein R3D98_14425 [Candidatus Krumholzibacteriia bacterium]
MQHVHNRRRRRHAEVYVLVGCLLLAAWPAEAAKFAGAFMENGGGARALGMGGAFTAVAGDASATFWNPAGLGRFRNNEVLLMHSERFGDLVDRDFASGVIPVNMSLFGDETGALGLTVIRLGVDDIPFTEHLFDQLDANGDGVVSDDALNPEIYELLRPETAEPVRYKGDQEFAAMLSYGERRGQWYLGGTLKVIHQNVGDYSSIGIGADLGALRPRFLGPIDFGLKLQDLTTTYLSWSTGTNEVIAPAVVPGFAYRLSLPSSNLDVLLASSFECRFENRGQADQWSTGSFSCNSHWGAELGFSRRVFVRAGVDSGFDTADITAGAGLILGPMVVDYAYAGDTLDIDEVTHRISLAVRW